MASSSCPLFDQGLYLVYLEARWLRFLCCQNPTWLQLAPASSASSCEVCPFNSCPELIF